MKLPVFWPGAAEACFALAEAQFAIMTVTVSKTKFYHAVARLSQYVAAQILISFMLNQPASNPYEVLKDCLITLLSLNNYQRFKQFGISPLSGDQKPSHLMNRMLALRPDDYEPDFILQGLFLRRLPIKVPSHLLQEKILSFSFKRRQVVP